MDHSTFDPRRVLALVGATGTGKSGVAVGLSETLPVEIVCMDSMQVYREIAIGTARPTPEELRRAPHHLYGFRSVRHPMSCAQYAAKARSCIAEVQSRGKLPLLVGGTGLYLKTLFEGLSPLPKPLPHLRDRLERFAARKGKDRLYRLLRRLDPRGAARLHPNDRQRVQRFLEVRIVTGRSMVDHWEQDRDQAGSRPPIAIGLSMDRPTLHRRLAQRIQAMLRQGWVEETRDLAREGLLESVCRIGPLGYAQIAEYLEGKLSLEELSERILVATRRYAKRQTTWFQKLPFIEWFPFRSKTGYNVPDILTFINMKLG